MGCRLLHKEITRGVTRGLVQHTNQCLPGMWRLASGLLERVWKHCVCVCVCVCAKVGAWTDSSTLQRYIGWDSARSDFHGILFFLSPLQPIFLLYQYVSLSLSSFILMLRIFTIHISSHFLHFNLYPCILLFTYFLLITTFITFHHVMFSYQCANSMS